MLAVTRVLAQTSRATATALRAADRVHRGELTVPAMLIAVVLEQHGDTLASAVIRHRTVLGSLTAGNDAVVGQAREIGTAVRSVLLPLARHPVEAREAAPSLCGYTRATAVATAALTQAADAAVRSRAVAIRDPSEDQPYPWRFASRSDVMPFLELLEQATIEIRSGLSSVAAITQPDRAAGPVATDATTALRAALERRQIALRPRSPGWPVLTSDYAQVHRAGSRTWIA
ncbi:hypothetical protein [Cellulomonas sp. P5_C5]